MTGWAGELLFETSVLLALVLLLRVPVRRAFGPKAAYLLWLAPLLRLLMPPLPPEAQLPAVHIQVLTGASLPASSLPQFVPADWLGLVILFWLGGAMLFLGVHVWHYQRFLRKALADATPIIGRRIDDAIILETEWVTGPAATGLLVRRVFIPREFCDRFGPEHSALALAHEVMHHRRGDLWASAAALLFLALHWWNPLAYAAHRAFRSDLEASCDADVISTYGEARRQAYAQTLLRCIAGPMPQPSCALTNVSQLKGRLHMIKLNHTSSQRRLGTLLSLAFGCTAVLLAMPAQAQQQAPDPAIEKKVERHVFRRVVKDGKVVEESGMPAELRAKLDKCVGDKFEATAGTPTDKKRTKILICGKPDATKAETAKILEEALSRMEGTTELPAENRAEIVARLKARIAELRSGN